MRGLEEKLALCSNSSLPLAAPSRWRTSLQMLEGLQAHHGQPETASPELAHLPAAKRATPLQHCDISATGRKLVWQLVARFVDDVHIHLLHLTLQTL